MYCLDTNVIIDLFDGKEEIRNKLEKINTKELCITPIILCELYKGATHNQLTERRMEFIRQLLNEVEMLNMNEHACKIFGEDYLKLKKIGKPISDGDLMISATCKAYNAVLITKDKKDFMQISELKLEIWQ